MCSVNSTNNQTLVSTNKPNFDAVTISSIKELKKQYTVTRDWRLGFIVLICILMCYKQLDFSLSKLKINQLSSKGD